jgi:hypothetical protein
MQEETTKDIFYWLLKIRIINPLFLFLIYPPIYALWLYAIGKFMLRQREKEFRTFRVFAIGSILFCTLIYAIVPLLILMHIDLMSKDKEIYELLRALTAMSFCVFWFGTLGMIAKITVDYERVLTPDKFNSQINFIDYFRRFFLLFWWYVGIWFIQPKVNKYLAVQTNDKVA